MSKLIGAMTKPGAEYPGYVNASRDDDGSIVLTVRGDPEFREDGAYVCGYARDKGKPGRCTPGDENCNNYCNSAPEKGPMQDHPKPCRQVFEGETVELRLTAEEYAEMIAEISK